MSRPLSVLFVCMGNICRSPTGEGLFKAYLEEQGVSELARVDSAGTISYHAGSPPDPRMTEAAACRGYRLEGSARPIRRSDFDDFDLVVAMDRENRADILDLGGAREGQVRLLSSFLPEGGPPDVPDPYYGGRQGFETVLDMIEEACPAIYEHLTEARADRE